MSGFESIRRVFRLGLAGGDSDREVDLELSFHREETVRRLMAEGLGEEEARGEAARRFGDEASYRRELRRLAKGRDRRARLLDAVLASGRVVRDAVRSLRRAPLLAAAVVAVMALGVGVNATMFGVLDRLFLTPPAHIDAPDDVKRFFVNIRRNTTGEIATQRYLPYPDYADWRDLEVFESTAVFSSRELVVGRGEGVERVPVALASASLFPLLGVRPALGRLFGPDDDVFGADPVAVLGHGYWQRRYGGDPGAIGRTVEAGDGSYTIVGVAPAGFTAVDLDRVDIWLPLYPAGSVEEGGTEWVDSRGWYWLEGVARLAPNTSPEAAGVAATTVHRAARADNEHYDPEATVELAPLLLARTTEASREARIVPWLMGVALMVLLLACANVANLLLARSMRQRRETAVRLALGVSRTRLVGTMVTEGVVLALLGGAAAVAVAVWGGGIIRGVLVPGARWESGADLWRVAAFSGALALLAGLFAGIVPAFRSSQPKTAEALKGSGRGVVRGRSGLRSGLLVVQAAISVVLLVGTSLFVLSLNAAKNVDLGFDPDPVLLVRLEPEGGYPGGEAMTRLYREARESIRTLAGVEATAISTTTPFRNARGIADELRVPGLDSLPRTRAGGAYIHAVTGDYFETLGLELLRGRGLRDADDSESAPRVAVVNETMAGLVWPEGDALGGCLIIRDEPCATVVGVVEDHHRFDLTEEASMHYYLPLTRAPYPWPPSRLMVRTSAPGALAPAIRRELGTLPGLRLVSAEPFRDVVDPSYRSWRLGATLFTAFGLLALLVASVGLYSVLAFEVAERRPEMGLRAALGATRNRLVGSVLASGVRLAGLGVLIGLAAGVYGAWAARELLFGTPPYAPGALILAGGTMLVVAAVASGVPAWRAANVDPNEALRGD